MGFVEPACTCIFDSQPWGDADLLWLQLLHNETDRQTALRLGRDRSSSPPVIKDMNWGRAWTSLCRYNVLVPVPTLPLRPGKVVRFVASCFWQFLTNVTSFSSHHPQATALACLDNPFWRSTPLTCVADCDLNKTACVCRRLVMVCLRTAGKNVLQHVKSELKRGRTV